MELVIDPDVKAVLEFMERELPSGIKANRSYVAKAVALIAPILWPEREEPIRMVPPLLLECDATSTVQESDRGMRERSTAT
jgi:hypothetical protein